MLITTARCVRSHHYTLSIHLNLGDAKDTDAMNRAGAWTPHHYER